mmetsp:Transcript_31496/g.106048  ORF Transcript_31496/g.106048 Transcript_31496/m.106048 type:complete len:221 (+) Transcript_31496:104-766(+)
MRRLEEQRGVERRVEPGLALHPRRSTRHARLEPPRHAVRRRARLRDAAARLRGRAQRRPRAKRRRPRRRRVPPNKPFPRISFIPSAKVAPQTRTTQAQPDAGGWPHGRARRSARVDCDDASGVDCASVSCVDDSAGPTTISASGLFTSTAVPARPFRRRHAAFAGEAARAPAALPVAIAAAAAAGRRLYRLGRPLTLRRRAPVAPRRIAPPRLPPRRRGP